MGFFVLPQDVKLTFVPLDSLRGNSAWGDGTHKAKFPAVTSHHIGHKLEESAPNQKAWLEFAALIFINE